MNYKIAICDDSAADRQYLYGIVGRWAANTGHTVQIALFPSAENFLFHYTEKTIMTYCCLILKWAIWTA